MPFNKKELKNLLDDVDKYDDAYYNQNKQLVSDEIYDGLKDKLRSLSKEFKPQEGSKADEKLSIRLQDALTRVGAPPPLDGQWPKYTHEIAMGSLNKVNLPEELTDWHRKCNSAKKLFITEKLDGLSVSLKYKEGKLIAGVTRGDGEIGENITRNVKKMQGVLETLKVPFTGHIRGEIILKHSDWKKYLPEMANPRNGASGIAKRIDGHKAQYLTVLVYTIEGEDFQTEEKAFEYLNNLGFSTPLYYIGDINCAKKQWQEYMDSTRETLDYDIDGLVIRVNDCTQQFALGEENHRPKGAIAFKFQAPQAETVITSIACQIGDTGRITPVAEFNEVELLGAKITRASLHNFSLVKELGVNVGASVLIERQNDVIPGVKKVTKGFNGFFKAPSKCPVCGSNTIQVGEYLLCPNKKDCPPQVIGRLNKWIKELGILEWGESILQKLIDAGKVKDVADLYRLQQSDIVGLERMGEKGAKKLLGELDKYREISLENFLGGLCIDGIATSTVRSIIDAGHDTLEQIQNLSVSELEGISGFGRKRTQGFFDGLTENEDRINDILSAGVKIKARIKGVLTGKSLAFTGKSSLPRAKLQKLAEEAGGVVKKSVGAGLDFLVIADPESTSSKAQAARKNNVKLISEEDFMEMIK